jgi:hypothetical protein
MSETRICTGENRNLSGNPRARSSFAIFSTVGVFIGAKPHPTANLRTPERM